MDKKRVMIADASVECSGQLCDRLGGVYTLRVCHSGLAVQEMLEEFRPDVLVMDLALPGLDGISVLQRMNSLVIRPRILLTTCFMSSYVESAIAGCGVDMVMLKPCKVEALAERVADLVRETEPKRVMQPKSQSTIANMLLELNIPAKRRGFGYLELGIRLYLEQPGQSLTKTIYPKVAKEFGTQPEAVERAIRQAIHESWNKRNDRVWLMYFCSGKEGIIPRPTNAEFISRLAERYKLSFEAQA